MKRLLLLFLVAPLITSCAGMGNRPALFPKPFTVIVTNAKGTTLHSKPRTISKKVTVAPAGDTLKVLGEANLRLFYQVEYRGVTGFVQKDHVATESHLAEVAAAAGKADAPGRRPGRANLIVEYDRFRDYTSYKTELATIKPIQLFSGNLAWLKMGGVAVCPGQEACMPEEVALQFVSMSDTWSFLRYRPLIFLVDGEPLDCGELSHDGSVGSGYVLEHMDAVIPVDGFLRIARANQVEMKIGRHEFVIPSEKREGLRSLADTIAPAAQRAELE